MVFFAQAALSYPVVPPHSPYNPVASSAPENPSVMSGVLKPSKIRIRQQGSRYMKTLIKFKWFIIVAAFCLLHVLIFTRVFYSGGPDVGGYYQYAVQMAQRTGALPRLFSGIPAGRSGAVLSAIHGFQWSPGVRHRI